MGRATIVENIGNGLFKIKLKYNMTKIDRELAELERLEAEYYINLDKALDTLIDLQRSINEASRGLDELLEKWKQGLLNNPTQSPPNITPDPTNDPETGLPWEDPDRAQDEPLFQAINAARAAHGISTVSRNNKIDAAVLDFLRLISQPGFPLNHYYLDSPGQRVYLTGYYFDQAIGVGELFALGCSTPQAAVNQWLQDSSDRTILLKPAYKDCGVAFVYQPSFYIYYWGAAFASPGQTYAITASNPVSEAAAKVDEDLKGIKAPRTEINRPLKLDKACEEYAKTTARYREAERAVNQLKTDHIERLKRIEILNNIKNMVNKVYDVWSCRYYDVFTAIGTEVYTAELPGFWQDKPVARTTKFGPRWIDYEERPINIVDMTSVCGQLQYAEGMTDAAIFYNLAMEPGHLRWKPRWRYGIILEIRESICDVSLIAMEQRKSKDDSNTYILDAPENSILTNITIDYPPCNGVVFHEGDEVLIYYDQFDRTKPCVVGFRREPRACPVGRMSWRQVFSGR